MFYHDVYGNIIVFMSFLCILLVFLKKYFQKKSLFFKESCDALEEHLKIFKRILESADISENDKKKLFKITLIVSSQETSGRFLDIVEKVFLDVTKGGENNYKKEDSKLSYGNARDLFAFFMSAIFVAGYMSGDKNRALHLAQSILSDEDKDVQIIYKFDWQECGNEYQKRYV